MDLLAGRCLKDLIIGTCNVKSLYRTRAWDTPAREVGKHSLDIGRILRVRTPDDGSVTKGNYILFHGKVYKDHCLGTGFLVKRDL